MKDTYKKLEANNDFKSKILEINGLLFSLGMNGISYNIKSKNNNFNHFDNLKFLDCFIENDMAINCPIINASSNILSNNRAKCIVWDKIPIKNKKQQEVMDARYDYEIKSGITIVKKNNNYTELIGLSSKQEINIINIFQENKIDILKKINDLRGLYNIPSNKRYHC